MNFGLGSSKRLLQEEEIAAVCDEALLESGLQGKTVLVVIPDHTRSCPLDVLFRMICERLLGQVQQLDFMIALGTHPPMSMDAIYQRVGISAGEHQERYASVRFFNHRWDDPDHLVHVGRFTKEQTGELTDGMFELDVDVRANKAVQAYDTVLICGPVFPHEVVGFSGGNKYLFPGISGAEVLHFFHWLGAVITNPRIIGNKWTPVRKVIDTAAAMLPLERRALCMVVKDGGLAGLFGGTPEEAWSAAADLSHEIHVRLEDRSYHTVLSRAPEMYDELWVAGKCMYKLEPVIADGGQLIIYAPHLKEISVVHEKLIREIGYHTRDYFLKQWDRFKHLDWGILAHSSHVKGVGTFEDGVEHPRIEVVLASQISEADCRQINLGYKDPESIKLSEYQDQEEQGVLYVPKAGEILYRWKDAPPELGGSACID